MVAALSNSDVFQRMLAPMGDDLPPEVARFLLGLAMAEPDCRRIESLSEKANEGDLTSGERDELAAYLLLSDFIAILQSRARFSMNKKSPA